MTGEELVPHLQAVLDCFVWLWGGLGLARKRTIGHTTHTGHPTHTLTWQAVDIASGEILRHNFLKQPQTLNTPMPSKATSLQEALHSKHTYARAHRNDGDIFSRLFPQHYNKMAYPM